MTTIDHVYVVNRDSKDDRLNRILAKLDASDLKYTPRSRIPSRDGQREDFSAYMSEQAQQEVAELLTRRQKRFATQMTRAGAGAYMTHMDVWQLVASLPDKSAHVLVLEDDVPVPPDINSRLRTAWDKASDPKAKHPVLVVWAAGEHIVNAKDVHKIVKTSRPLLEDPVAGLAQVDNFWGLSAYSLTPRTAAVLLEPRTGLLPMDVQLEAALLQPQTRKAVTVHVCPRLSVGSAPDVSVIQTVLPLHRMPSSGTAPRIATLVSSGTASVATIVIPVVIVAVLLIIAACLVVVVKHKM